MQPSGRSQSLRWRIGSISSGTPESTRRFTVSLARLAEGGEQSGPLSRLVSEQSTLSLQSAFRRLSSTEQDALTNRLGEAGLEELIALSAEPNPEMLLGNLLSFGIRQEQADRLEVAATIYSFIQAHGSHEVIRHRAGTQLDALLGRGAAGPRMEFLARRFAQEVTSPTALFAMGTAGAVFKVTRVAALSRLMANPSLGILSRGLGARTAAGLIGFMTEAPAFTLSGRLAGEALGVRQDWGGSAFGRDLASSFLVLGGLKLAGGASTVTARRLEQISNVGARHAAPLQGIAARIVPQLGMFAGISLGHHLEQSFGIRPHHDGATTAIDSLSLLLQFNVMGRFNRAAFGEGFHAWERGLDLQAEALSRTSHPRHPNPFQIPELDPAHAFAFRATGRGPTEASRRPHILMMVNQGDGNGEKPEAGEGYIATSNESLFPSEEAARVEEISAQQELQILLESTPDGVVTANHRGFIIKANRAMQRIYGYAPEELIGRPLTVLIPQELQNRHTEQLQAYVRTGKANLPRGTAIELPSVHRDGRPLSVLISFGEYQIGDRLYFTGIIRDITEQKRQQAEYDRLLAEMEQLSNEGGPPSEEPSAATKPFEMVDTSDIVRDCRDPISRVFRRLAAENVEIRLTASSIKNLSKFAPALRAFLNLRTQKLEIPLGRSLTVELSPNERRPTGALVMVKGTNGFEIQSEPQEPAEISPPSGPAVEIAPAPIAIGPASPSEATGRFRAASALLPPVEGVPEPATARTRTTARFPAIVIEKPSDPITDFPSLKRLLSAETLDPDKMEAGALEIRLGGPRVQSIVERHIQEIIDHLEASTSDKPFPLSSRIALVCDTENGPVRTVFIRGTDGFSKFTSARRR